MSISGISSSVNAYQQSMQVQTPTPRGPQQSQDATAAKNVMQNPVAAISNKTEITKRPNDTDKSSRIGQNVNVMA